MSANLTPALPGPQTALAPAGDPAALAPYRSAPDSEGSPPMEAQVRRVVAALDRYKWLIALTTLAGVAGGFLASRYVNPDYQVQSTIFIPSVPSGSRERRTQRARPDRAGPGLHPARLDRPAQDLRDRRLGGAAPGALRGAREGRRLRRSSADSSSTRGPSGSSPASTRSPPPGRAGRCRTRSARSVRKASSATRSAAALASPGRPTRRCSASARSSSACASRARSRTRSS
jgi:hypothetical protein